MGTQNKEGIGYSTTTKATAIATSHDILFYPYSLHFDDGFQSFHKIVFLDREIRINESFQHADFLHRHQSCGGIQHVFLYISIEHGTYPNAP